MAKVFRRLEVEKVKFSLNGLVTRQLPLTVFKHLHLRLKVTHTNGVAPVISVYSLCKLVSKIQITLNGQDTLVSLPLFHLPFANSKEFGVENFKSLFTTASTQGVSFIDLFLPFYLPRSISPEDTLLDARGLSSAVLEVQWGSAIGADVTSIDDAELQIVTGEFAQVAGDAKFARHEYGYSSGQLDSVGTIQHKLDVGSNNQYRRIWLYTLDSAGALSDALINKIGILSRAFYYSNTSAESLKGSNVAEFGQANDVGVYCLDFCPEGKMSQRIDARPLSELLLEISSLVANGSYAVIKEKVIYA
jgi:hypothetical protein